jgi:hypothetical protein
MRDSMAFMRYRQSWGNSGVPLPRYFGLIRGGTAARLNPFSGHPCGATVWCGTNSLAISTIRGRNIHGHSRPVPIWIPFRQIPDDPLPAFLRCLCPCPRPRRPRDGHTSLIWSVLRYAPTITPRLPAGLHTGAAGNPDTLDTGRRDRPGVIRR